MRLAASAILLCSLMLAGGPADDLAADDVPQARIEGSRGVAASFAAELKEALTRAMAASGPLGAVYACRSIAPAIAAEASAESGWRVGRTSLKTRNVSNAPDAWEAEVLQSFIARKAAGEDPGKMEVWTIAEDGGQKRFRYMKAIPTASQCLTCHGSNIDPELRAHLDALYPSDTAVGYSEGDIRGAFTISQPM